MPESERVLTGFAQTAQRENNIQRRIMDTEQLRDLREDYSAPRYVPPLGTKTDKQLMYELLAKEDAEEAKIPLLRREFPATTPEERKRSEKELWRASKWHLQWLSNVTQKETDILRGKYGIDKAVKYFDRIVHDRAHKWQKAEYAFERPDSHKIIPFYRKYTRREMENLIEEEKETRELLAKFRAYQANLKEVG
jgi:hypothetical protein